MRFCRRIREFLVDFNPGLHLQLLQIIRSKMILSSDMLAIFSCAVSNFNLFYRRATKALPCLDGGEVSMKQPKATESKILTVKDEDIFFALIEERMEQQGFELLNTFAPLPQSLVPTELT